MQRGGLADLSELLARAMALVGDLGSAPTLAQAAERPSFLVPQHGNDPRPIIERIAGAQRLTFVLGAGASMEAGLPSWGGLVPAVLEAAAPAALSESDRVAWLDAAAEPGLLGMAATARALACSDEEFVKRVEHQLYRGKGSDHFDPGALVREIAAWKRAYPEIRLATFNYDQLLERALEDVGLEVEAREDNNPEQGGVCVVRHLHGLLTGRPAEDAVILTEGDYALWPVGSWQDHFMRDALEGICVFLGLSLSRFVPVIVTAVPPANGPDTGLTPVTAGAGGNALAGGAVIASRPRPKPKLSRTITQLRGFDLIPAVVCARRGLRA